MVEKTMRIKVTVIEVGVRMSNHDSHPLCQHKRNYETVEEARHARNERQKYERLRLYCYRCQFCDGIHLTKIKPPTENIL